jgi:hypothetical protein
MTAEGSLFSMMGLMLKLSSHCLQAALANKSEEKINVEIAVLQEAFKRIQATKKVSANGYLAPCNALALKPVWTLHVAM